MQVKLKYEQKTCMRSFDYDDRQSGGRGGRKFGGRSQGLRGYEDRDSGRPAMHKATCTYCGRACEVPFRPTGNKPVLCSDCFKGSSAPSFGRQSRGRDFSKSRFDDKRMYEAVCDKCHKTCEVPFRPTGEKPVFCSECFTKGDSTGAGKGNDQLVKQMEAINIKLDRILKALARTSPDLDFIIDDTEKSIAKSKKGGVIVVASKAGRKAPVEEKSETVEKEKKEKKPKKEKTAKKAIKKTDKKVEKKKKK